MSESVTQLAQPLTERLATAEQVEGVLCFGSRALGVADALSDIDLYVLYKGVKPSQQARAQLFSDISSDLSFSTAQEAWSDEWIEPGERVELEQHTFDIGYKPLAWVETVVNKVTQQGLSSVPEMPFRAYTLLGLLDTSILLYDREGKVKAFIASLYPYPDKLKKTLVNENKAVLSESLEELEQFVKRNVGNTAFHFHLMRALDALGGLLFAINERYDPATKYAETVLERLTTLPENFMRRYERLLLRPFTPDGKVLTVRDLRLLANEVFDLSA